MLHPLMNDLSKKFGKEELVDDPVANFEAPYTSADRYHFACAIRERHTTGRDWHRILTIENHQVANVDRARL